MSQSNRAVQMRSGTLEDVRIKRTRSALGQALIELTLERGFEAITVRDLTGRAEVGYATFFRHYKGKEDLLQKMLEEVLCELTGLLRPLSTDEQPVEQGTLLFQHAQQNADLYRVLLRAGDSDKLLAKAVAVGINSIYDAFEEKPSSVVPLEVAAHHFIYSCVNLIEWWLEHDMPYSPERMGQMFNQLIVSPTKAAALQAKRN